MRDPKMLEDGGHEPPAVRFRPKASVLDQPKHHVKIVKDRSASKKFKSKEGKSIRGKIPLVTNWERQDLLHQQEAAAQANQYRKEPEPSQVSHQLLYYWNETTSPEELLGRSLSLLDEIRQTLKVHIVYDVGLKSFKFFSTSEDTLLQAHDAVNKRVRKLQISAEGARDLYLLDAPGASDGSNEDPVYIFSEREIPVKESRELRATSIDRRESNKQRLTRRLSEVIPILRETPALKIRVHFGQLKLVQFRKSLFDDLTLAKIDKALSETRTTAKLEKSIGDASVAINCLLAVWEEADLFYPIDIDAENITDVRPQHNLILFGRDADNRTIRIESELELLDPTAEREQYQSDFGRWYLPDTEKQLLQVCCFNMERLLDWSLAITTETQLFNLVKGLQGLSIGLSVDEVVDELQQKYPIFQIKVPFGLKVDSTILRSTYMFGINNTPYSLEIAIYRIWEGTNMRSPYKTNCGMALSNRESWRPLGEQVSPCQTYESRIEPFFSGDLDSEGSILHLLSTVRRMQTLFDKTMEL